MNLRTGKFAIVALWAVLAVGCQDGQSDRPASRPEATEPAEPSPDSTTPETEPGTEPGTEPDSPTLDTPATATDPQPDSSEDVVEDLESVLKEIAVLEQDAKFFEAFTRARDLLKTYRGRPEASKLSSLQHRLYQFHRRSSGLDFAIGQLGSDSEVAVSVATGKLLDAGEVGLVFLRKAVRKAEPKIAAGAAEILVEQGEPQTTRLMIERMEQDPPEPLGNDLGKLLQRLDTIESEWIDRLCALARREGTSRAGAVDVLIDRLERSIRTQLETVKPKDAQPEDAQPETAEKEQPEPAPVEVDPRLVRTLYEVALADDGTLQRQAVEALVLVLEEVSQRDARAFNQLAGSEEAYGFVGDYVVANLESEQLEDRLWTVPRAAPLHLQAAGFWARIRPDDATVLYERLDPALSFADLTALRVTGPVDQGQTIQWAGFVNVPADGDYTFSVDCAETSPTTLFVDSEPTTADKAVKLSAGWHEVRAEMSLSGDAAKLYVAWEGPDLGKQNIPADRVVCADRTRVLIWRLGRKCDLAEARSLAAQLLSSIQRIDEQLIEKLALLAQVDNPARPAVAAVLGEVLDYSIAHQTTPPEWESQLLSGLLGASKEISGPEQRRVVASMVHYLVQRTESKIDEFNTKAESSEAYAYMRAFIAERLDDEDPEAARWAMHHAGAVQLALKGLWAKTYANANPAEADILLDERSEGSLSFADPAALRLGLAKRVVWEGYLSVPAEGPYKFSVDSGEQVAIRLDGEAIAAGTAIELTAGLHPVVVEFRLASAQPKLIVSWQGPSETAPVAIPADRLICPAWPKVLTWEMSQKPEQAEALAARLGMMINRIDQVLAAQLLPLVTPDSPSAIPAAEVLARLLQTGQLDDTFEKTLVEPLWPLVDKTDGPRQRVFVGAMIRAFERLFGKEGPAFDKAVKAEGTPTMLRDFVISRLDSKETDVAAWAMGHTGPFGLGQTSGLWTERLASPDGPPVREFHYYSNDLNFADLAAVMGATGAREGEAIHWTGFLKCPISGAYVFAVDAGAESPVAMKVAGQPIELGKPIELAAGLHAVELSMTIGPDAKLVLNWQQPYTDQPALISRNSFACPIWEQLLVWQLQQEPELARAEELCVRLGRMDDRISQPLVQQLLPLIAPDSPIALPVAEVVARVLRRGHLDDTYEKTLCEQLWPFVDKSKDERQRTIVGALVTKTALFANDAVQYDKAMKVEGAFLKLRDFVAARLDAEEANVATWAMDLTGPFGLSLAAALWTERLALPDRPPVGEFFRIGELNFGDLSAVMGAGRAKQGEVIRWTGYLNCPSDGPYVFAVDAGAKSPVAMKVAGQAIEFGKPVELAAGSNPIDVQVTIGADAKLVLNWQQPGQTQPALLSRNSFTCPAWPKLLVWQLYQEPELEQAEEICTHLARMMDQIDASLAGYLLPLIKPDAPLALPVAELVARLLRNTHLDDNFERTLPEYLCPLVAKAEGPRQRVIVGSLIETITRGILPSGEGFDTAAKVKGTFRSLGDFIIARLDDKETDVAAWAVNHSGPFGLGHSGLWMTRLASADGAAVREQLFSSELNCADLAAVLAATGATTGQTIRWTGFLRCPGDGPYVFTIGAGTGSPAAMKVAGQAIVSGQPIELKAGLQEAEITLTIGADAKLVIQWKQPGATEAAMLHANSFMCPAWAKVLVWQLQQEPELPQAEEICARLNCMVDQIDHQYLAPQLQAMLRPDSPLALPVAEVLARVVSNGHMDDTYERSLAAPLSLLVENAEGERKRILVGSLITIFDRLFSKKAADFDAAAKAPTLSQQLRDFVTERLDAKELPVRLWAAKHADPFGLLGAGLEGSYFDAGFKNRLFDRIDTKMQFEPGQFTYPDKRHDNIGVRWSGLIRVPADGAYIFSCIADETCRLWLDGQPVIQDAKRPATANLTAGLQEIRVEYVETTGPERLVVNWQPPGQSQPQVLAGELTHVDPVQLLLRKLTRRPDDPQAAAWLTELSYKTDRLDAASLDRLIPLAQKNAALETPLASVLAAAILRDPNKAPPKAAPQLSQTVPDLTGAVRRRAVEALVAYCSVVCGRDKTRYQQAVGAPGAYDFLSKEIQSAADSGKAADTEWAQQQSEILGLELGSPDE